MFVFPQKFIFGEILYLAIFLLVSSRQNFLSFSFPHFLCIFSEDDATLGKDISRSNPSFFLSFIPEKIKKTKAIGKDSSSRKEKKKGKICWKIKVFGKDWTNLAKGLWSRSLLRQKRRPWSSFPMTQGLQNYYIVCFCSDLSNRERIKKIAPKRINQICWNIVWPCICDYTS